MTRTLYALLVGIDAYPSPVPSLNGCVNDIIAFESHLKGRTAGGQFELRVLKLTDQAATRQAVMNGFLHHLAQAGPEDVALFYYSGHGSKELTPPEFWNLEPDHRNETLVCWDSRMPGGWDLADKELAYLIHEVARRDPHIAIFLDCCHSGSGTRDAHPTRDVRWAPADDRTRPIESYYFAPEIVAGQRDVLKSGWPPLPQGRHVLLAACRSDQRAREYRADEKTWGVFSYFLRAALEEANGEIIYRDLFKQTQARVRASVPDQSPQIEALSPDDLDQPFLGGAISPRPLYFTISHIGTDWVMDAGALHGIAAPRAGETTHLALFPMDTSPEQLSDLTCAAAEAVVASVTPGESLLTIVQGVEQLDLQRTYKALITSLPQPPMGVKLQGEEDGVQLVRAALANSLHVQEAPTGARLSLTARGGIYTITYPDQDNPLVGRLLGYNSATARQVVERLAHIARWLRTLELRNPASQLPLGAVRMWITRPGEPKEIEPDQLVFSYQPVGGQWEPPAYELHLENTSKKVLYASLLGLWESFAIEVLPTPSPVTRLEPGESVHIPFTGTVPDDAWRYGVTDSQDVFKVIASTDEFDASPMAQGRVDSPYGRISRSLGYSTNSTLQRLMQRHQTRAAGTLSPATRYSDWVTNQLAVTHHRPLEGQPVPSVGDPVTLGLGVRLGSHPGLGGRARITDLPPTSRDAALPELPDLLSGRLPGSQPYFFRVTRGMTAENMLELRNVADYSTITPQAPLRLYLPARLQKTESVLAYGYDGEFFLPLGASRTDGNETVIDLVRLPALLEATTGRDSLGAARIFFQKITHEASGLPNEYPVLTAAEVGPGGRVMYQSDPKIIRTQVAPATCVTLFIHGITGETRGMLATAPQYLKGDVLLAFDYELANTSIEEMARTLKERLETIGLGVGHGKRLRIVAHSWGGLLARYLVEQVEGGKQIFQQVILLGVPNRGTPWHNVQQFATLGISLALNGLSTPVWPVKAMAWMLGALEKADMSMEDVQPNAGLLQTLHASDDPQVPYILIAGESSVAPTTLEGGENSPLARLLQRLGYDTGLLPFFHEPNDLLVSVSSAHDVPAGRSPAPHKITVSCDHVTYFEPGMGLEILKQQLGP